MGHSHPEVVEQMIQGLAVQGLHDLGVGELNLQVQEELQQCLKEQLEFEVQVPVLVGAQTQ